MIIKNVYGKYQIDKKIIARCGNALGGAFIISFLINELIQRVISWLIMAGVIDASALLGDGFMWVYQILISAFMFVIPFIIVTPFMNVRVSIVCEFKKPDKKTFTPTLLVGIGVMMLSNSLSSMSLAIFQKFGFTVPEGLTVSPDSGVMMKIVALLGGAALPALIEEFAMRGIALGSLKRFGASFSIIVSSALFGLMHGNVLQIPFAFVMGLYLGFATLKTGSVWTAVILHFINNFFSFALELSQPYLSNNLYYFLNGIYFVSALGIGLLGVLTAVKQKGFFKLEKGEDEQLSGMRLSEKLSHFVATPGIIIFLLYIVYEIVLFQLSAMLSVNLQ